MSTWTRPDYRIVDGEILLRCEHEECLVFDAWWPLVHFPSELNPARWPDRLGYNGWCTRHVEEYQAAVAAIAINAVTRAATRHARRRG